MDFKSVGKVSQTFDIPQTQIPGTPIDGIDYYKLLGVSNIGDGPFSFLFDYMDCENAQKPGECKWGVGAITGNTNTSFAISWTQESCGAQRSIFKTRPICYPINFCPLDSVNAELEAPGTKPVVCQDKCPTTKSIAYLDSLVVLVIVH